MFSKFIILFVLIFSLSACATVEQPTSKTACAPLAPGPAPAGITHIVQRGETLWRISKVYRIDLDDILRTNRITDARGIAVGQKIVIPVSTENKLSQTNFTPKDADTDFIWPVKGRVLAYFRDKVGGVLNKGIDIQTGPSQNVLASHQGKVAFVGSIAGYGPTLIIDHQDGLSTIYCGNTNIAVKLGDTVQQGMVIARTGAPLTNGYGALHFEIRKKQKPQNPLYYLVD